MNDDITTIAVDWFAACSFREGERGPKGVGERIFTESALNSTSLGICLAVRLQLWQGHFMKNSWATNERIMKEDITSIAGDCWRFNLAWMAMLGCKTLLMETPTGLLAKALHEQIMNNSWTDHERGHNPNSWWLPAPRFLLPLMFCLSSSSSWPSESAKVEWKRFMNKVLGQLLRVIHERILKILQPVKHLLKMIHERHRFCEKLSWTARCFFFSWTAPTRRFWLNILRSRQ